MKEIELANLTIDELMDLNTPEADKEHMRRIEISLQNLICTSCSCSLNDNQPYTITSIDNKKAYLCDNCVALK